MKKYIVEIPIRGYISYDIEASDEETAIDAAWEDFHAGLQWDWIEWETFEDERIGETVTATESKEKS